MTDTLQERASELEPYNPAEASKTSTRSSRNEKNEKKKTGTNRREEENKDKSIKAFKYLWQVAAPVRRNKKEIFVRSDAFRFTVYKEIY